MTNYITVRNNCKNAPIHCAISASVLAVQQSFNNDLPPNGKGYTEWELSDAGWHDFVAVIAAEENRFKPENNDQFEFRKLLVASPVLAVAGPLGWALAAAGTVAAVVLDRVGGVPVYTTNIPGVGKVQFTVKDGAKLDLWPVVIRGLYTPHGNDITISGGDIKYEYDKATKRYVILGVEPLRAHWSNRMSPKSEGDYVAAPL